jgi:hypothetical protein
MGLLLHGWKAEVVKSADRTRQLEALLVYTLLY